MSDVAVAERLADWHYELAGLRVDRAGRLVRNVALTGCESRNGYRYSESALREAVGLYDRKPVFLDHAEDRSRPLERSTRDLVGTVVEPRFEEGRIRADVQVLDTESGRTFLALVEGETPGIGMSQVVLARRSTDGKVIEQIEDVVSVDAVINPATTRTFRESAEGTADAKSGASGLDCEAEESDASKWRQEVASLREQVTELAAERDELRESLRARDDRQVEERREQRLEGLLAQSTLPGWAVTETFRRMLRKAGDEAACRELIRERADLVIRASRHPPTSLGRSAEASLPEDAAFVLAVKRR